MTNASRAVPRLTLERKLLREYDLVIAQQSRKHAPLVRVVYHDPSLLDLPDGHLFR